jgi:hypothetical protein
MLIMMGKEMMVAVSSFFVVFFRFVEWKEFSDNIMVQNPRGGTAVFPKMITAVANKNKIDLHGIKDQPYYSKATR